MKYKLKGLLKYRPVFGFVKFIAMQLLKRKVNYHFEKVVPQNHPYIVLANHNTDYDPLMVGVSFPKLLYYVASDFIFRWGFISKVIVFLVDPIPRLKAVTEAQTVKQILKRTKAGANICIFAEGNTSFSGETGPIPASTGKLIKQSGAALITYRLDGGYFSSPRWSSSIRRGRMNGRMVREYSAKEIEAMTADELNEVISKDLYVNAYKVQEENPIDYIGIKLAENLETGLYLCPNCGSLGTLKSEDDAFYCTCGLHLRYTTKGYFVTKDASPPPFSTVLDWSKWQSTRVVEMAEQMKLSTSDQPILSDPNQSLWLISKASKSELVDKGWVQLYKDKLVFIGEDEKEYCFYFNRIFNIAINGQKTLIFSTIDRDSYEIKSDHPRSALKYLEFYEALREKVIKNKGE